MLTEGKKPCVRCLLKDFDRDAYFKNLYDYIDGLDEEIRAEETLYQKRLERCKQCDLLAEGMCRACGCFVELRAAIAKNGCPYSHW